MASHNTAAMSRAPGAPLVAHRIPALDGVRGCAALVVCCYHLLIAGSSGGSAVRVVQAMLSVGWAGVDLFFVLSGFLITGILLETQNSGSYFRTFYARRALRIFPLYYGVVLFALSFPHLLKFQFNGVQ